MLVLIFIVLASAGCGGSSRDDPDPTVSPSETPIPSETATPTPKIGTRIGNIAPDFVFEKTYNAENLNATKLSDLRGKVVIINFWASWCPFCVREMPALEALANRYSSREVVLIGVNTLTRGETYDKGVRFVDDRNITFPIVFDVSHDIGGEYHAINLPTTYFIDQDGKIVGFLIGEIDANRMSLVRTKIDILLRK